MSNPINYTIHNNSLQPNFSYIIEEIDSHSFTFSIPEEQHNNLNILLTSEMLNSIFEETLINEPNKINIVSQQYDTLNEDLMNKNLSCSICFEEYIKKSQVSVLSCEHCFHKNCIQKWAEKNNSCPICREIIPTI
jgi:hypothetical protein